MTPTPSHVPPPASTLPAASTPAPPPDKPPYAEVEEAIRFLRYALSDLREAIMKARIQRLYQRLFRPIALLGAFLGVGALTSLLLLLKIPGSTSFSIALLGYLLPLLFFAYRLPDTQGIDLQNFMSDVHRSDQALMEYGERSLLPWPLLHPEEALASSQAPSFEALRSSVTSRLDQLLAARETLWLERVKPLAPTLAPEPLQTTVPSSLASEPPTSALKEEKP